MHKRRSLLGIPSMEGLGVTAEEAIMKTIDPDNISEAMIRAGGEVLAKLLYSYDVIGGWPDDEVLPDVFRAMISVAPEVPHVNAPRNQEVRRR